MGTNLGPDLFVELGVGGITMIIESRAEGEKKGEEVCFSPSQKGTCHFAPKRPSGGETSAIVPRREDSVHRWCYDRVCHEPPPSPEEEEEKEDSEKKGPE